MQLEALVETNHGYVNLIMNEYAYYGKGHTIHSSGQIERIKNQVMTDLSKWVDHNVFPHLVAKLFLGKTISSQKL